MIKTGVIQMSLTIERKGEIALVLLKQKMQQEGVKITPNFLRQIGSTAKETGLPPGELREFVELLTRELIEEVFAK